MTNQEISVYNKEITEAGFSKAMEEIDENEFSKVRRIKYYKAISNTTGKAYPPPLLIEKAYEHSTNQKLPVSFFKGIGKGSIHFKFLESKGFNVVLAEEIGSMKKKYLLKLSKTQDLRNEIYIPKKYIGESDKFFKDPRTEDPNPLGESPHITKIQMKWKGSDIDYKDYELKNFRSEFDANNDTRIAGTPRKELNSIMLFFKNDDDKYDVEIVNEDSDEYENMFKILDGESYLLIDDIDKIKNMSGSDIKYPLNQILYGPPGTGKTYKTIIKALRIIGKNEIVNELEAEKDQNLKAVIYLKALELFNDQIGKQIEFVTMHQSYSYEDFIEGLKPIPADNDNGFIFDYKKGVFKDLCDRIYGNELTKKTPFEEVFKLLIEEVEGSGLILSRGKAKWKIDTIEGSSLKCSTKAGDGKPYTMNKATLEDYYEDSNYSMRGNNDGYYQALRDFLNEISQMQSETDELNDNSRIDERNFVIILDEINRCNISKVFGELITLIEDNKRDKFVTRLPSGKLFKIPRNLYIIGTMNTADKSVSMVDIALRRRFEFEAMYPDLELVHDEDKNSFLKKLNEEIRGNNGKGKGIDFQIGHADFMKSLSLKDTLNNKTIPLLMEYYRNKTDEIKVLLEKCLPTNIVLDQVWYKNTGLLKVQ